MSCSAFELSTSYLSLSVLIPCFLSCTNSSVFSIYKVTPYHCAQCKQCSSRSRPLQLFCSSNPVLINEIFCSCGPPQGWDVFLLTRTIQSVVTVDFLSAETSWVILSNTFSSHIYTYIAAPQNTLHVFIMRNQVLDHWRLMNAEWWVWGKSCSWVWRSLHDWSCNTYQVAEVHTGASVSFDDAGSFVQTACVVEMKAGAQWFSVCCRMTHCGAFWSASVFLGCHSAMQYVSQMVLVAH